MDVSPASKHIFLERANQLCHIYRQDGDGQFLFIARFGIIRRVPFLRLDAGLNFEDRPVRHLDTLQFAAARAVLSVRHREALVFECFIETVESFDGFKKLDEVGLHIDEVIQGFYYVSTASTAAMTR